MIGAIIGDIIGSRFEAINHNKNRDEMFKEYDFEFFTEKSRFTDDTVLTCAIADSLLSDKPYDENLKIFGNKYPLAGYGSSFKSWLGKPDLEQNNSYGNGSAMRVSPVGFYFNTLEEVLRQAELTAIPTHNSPEAIKGAQAVASAVFLARTGKSKQEIKDYIINTFGYNLNRTLDEIKPNYEFSATCELSVPESITAFLESNDFESAIRKAISIGGDSDTIACIAGVISEAFYGMAFIPAGILNRASLILKSTGFDLYKTMINFETAVWQKREKEKIDSAAI